MSARWKWLLLVPAWALVFAARGFGLVVFVLGLACTLIAVKIYEWSRWASPRLRQWAGRAS